MAAQEGLTFRCVFPSVVRLAPENSLVLEIPERPTRFSAANAPWSTAALLRLRTASASRALVPSVPEANYAEKGHPGWVALRHARSVDGSGVGEIRTHGPVARSAVFKTELPESAWHHSGLLVLFQQ